ncbi:MAG: ATP-binding protein [Candidatus Thorarchaeota archaeon]
MRKDRIDVLPVLISASSLLTLVLLFQFWTSAPSVQDQYRDLVCSLVALGAVFSGFLAILFIEARDHLEMLTRYALVSILVLVPTLIADPVNVLWGNMLLIYSIPIVGASLLIEPEAGFVMAGLASVANTLAAVELSQLPNPLAIIGFFLLAVVSMVTSRRMGWKRPTSRSYARLNANSEERYKTVLESLPEGILVVQDGIVVYSNREAERLLEVDSSDSILNKKVIDLFDSEFRRIMEKVITQVNKRGIPSEVGHVRMKRLDSTSFDVQIAVASILFGGVESTQIVFRDLSEVKSLEETIRRLFRQQVETNRLALSLAETFDVTRVFQTIEEHLEKVIPFNSLTLSLYDEEKKTVRAAYATINGKVVDVSNLPAIPLEEEGKGTQSQVIRSGRYLYVPDLSEAVRTTHTTYSFDESGKISEGFARNEESTSQSALYAPLRVGDRIAGVMQVQSNLKDAYSQDTIDLFCSMANVAALAIHKAVLFDELQRSNEALRNAVDTASLYTDLMAHDLRQSLQAATTGLEIIDAEADLENVASMRDLVFESLASADRLIQKVQSTRDLFNAPLVPIDLRRLVEEAAEEFANQHDEVELISDISVDEAFVLADQYLSFVIANLLENAVVHSNKKEKRVWISLEIEHDGYGLCVEDNGPGMTDERKESLFDPERRFGGVGIHQSIRIVKKYGGFMAVEDRVEGDPAQGARFRVWIPRSRDELPSG